MKPTAPVRNASTVIATTDSRGVILELPSMTAFQAWYESPEYQAILPLRLKSTPGTLIVAKGFTPSGYFVARRRDA